MTDCSDLIRYSRSRGNGQAAFVSVVHDPTKWERASQPELRINIAGTENRHCAHRLGTWRERSNSLTHYQQRR
jgi:hypothetical protein